MADDLGYGDLSCYGATRFQTPQIDTLAREGIRFTDAHSPHSVCTPTRYAVLTGRYAWRGSLKSKVLWSGYEPLLVEEGRRTIGHMMKELGYRTAQIGKWHLGWGDDGGRTDFDKKNVRGPRLIADDWNTAQVDEAYTGKAINFLRTHKTQTPGQPFYLHLTYEAPHKPHDVPDRFVGASGVSPHCDQVLYLDENVGEMLKAVEELGYWENTLVLFTSDNGAEPDGEGQKRGHSPNGDLRGQKRSILEGGHRVPLLARWPGKIKAGTTSDSLVCLIDLMATCAAITGYTLTDDMGEDSFNVLPTLLGSREVIRQSIIHQDITGTLGIRSGTWKFVPAARKTRLDPGDLFAVFDMAEDWRETTNLAEKHPGRAEELKTLLTKQKAAGRTAFRSE